MIYQKYVPSLEILTFDMDAIGSQPKPECSSSAFAVSTPVTDNPSEEFFLPGPIRRRRFSSARIQPVFYYNFLIIRLRKSLDTNQKSDAK